MFEDHPILYDYMMLNKADNISTSDDLTAFYYSGKYRPQENSDDVFLMTSLMIVLGPTKVSHLPFFRNVVRDIKNYVTRVHHFDRHFITVGFLFCKELMPFVDHELMQALIKRTIENFESISPEQISYACLHSFLLHDKDHKNRLIKEELFKRLEQYLDFNEAMLMEGVNRKAAQQLLISLSATKLGSPKTWRIAESVLQKCLLKEN